MNSKEVNNNKLKLLLSLADTANLCAVCYAHNIESI